MKVFPKINTSKEAQEMYTPNYATDLIVPHIPKNKIVWEMCYGKGHMARRLQHHNIEVVGEGITDCFVEQPKNFDIIVTNPPYTGNLEFIEKCMDSGKPFALLIRIEHLGGVAKYNLFKDLGADMKILIPERRVNFITPKDQRGVKGKRSSPFHTIWLTYKLVEDTRQIIYIPLETSIKTKGI